MRIISFTAENFKKIRVVEIVPKGRRTVITGRNGQGKTSVLDALWALFAGKRAIPEKPVRRGAEKSKLRAIVSDEQGRPFLIAQRTIAGDRTTNLIIEAAPGATRPAGTPQAVLDALIGEMSFDPIAFIHAEPKNQLETLRGLVKLDIDLDNLNEATKQDYSQRTMLNREAAHLRAQAESVIYSPGLPQEKVDEADIAARLAAAAQQNQALAARLEEKARLGQAVKEAEEAEASNRRFIEQKRKECDVLAEQEKSAEALIRWATLVAGTIQDRLLAEGDGPFDMAAYGIGLCLRNVCQATQTCIQEERKAATIRDALRKACDDALQAALNIQEQLAVNVAEANKAFEEAPVAEMVDLRPLLDEQAAAQLTNREIDKRTRQKELAAQAHAAARQAETLTRQMEAREELKRETMAGVKMPLEGLTFNEEGVWFKGIPLPQLGDAEQIRVGCALAMAANPKLRCIPIARGESLDDESLEMLDKMAEENDFQIFMAKVDSSGKVGIVLEDGMVLKENG
jgi:energy-coupling factor transporter ATP-binding protein EcfA2